MKKKTVTGLMFPCELKKFGYDGEIMLPSKKLSDETECECFQKSHKAKIYQVTIKEVNKKYINQRKKHVQVR